MPLTTLGRYRLGMVTLGRHSAGPDAVSATLRDADVIDAVVAALKATGRFDGVFWGELPDRRGRPAELPALAIVEPQSWEETDEFDDPTQYQIVGNGTFRLTLIVRDPDPRTRDRKLDRLASAAKNAIDFQSLAGLTIPGLTILRRGRYQDAASPERRMTIVGEYSCFVDGPSSHGIEP